MLSFLPFKSSHYVKDFNFTQEQLHNFRDDFSSEPSNRIMRLKANFIN